MATSWLLRSPSGLLAIPLISLIAVAANLISLGWILFGKALQYRVYFAVPVDALLITSAVHYLGGVESTFSWVCVIALISVGSMHGVRVGLYASTVYWLMYSGLLAAEFIGWLPHAGQDILSPSYLNSEASYILLKSFSNLALFSGSSAIAGFLAERLLRSKRELERMVAERTEKLETANEQLRKEILERTQAEQELAVSEERYRTLVDNSLNGVCIIQDEIFRFVNRRILDVWGYDRSDLEGTSFLNFVHPDDRSRIAEGAMKTMMGLAPSQQDHYRTLTRDGAVLWIETFGTLIEYEGRPALMVDFIDITERKKAEDALRQSEKRYSTTLDAVPDIVYESALDGTFLYINRAVSEILGYSSEHLGTVSFPELLDEEGRETARESVRRILRTGMPSTNTFYNVKAADGRIVPVEAHATLLDREGHPPTILGVARDITERRKAEQQLRESEEKYRSLFEESKDVIFMTSRKGNFLDINPAGLELLGYSSKEEMLKIDLDRDLYVDPEDHRELLKVLERCDSVRDHEQRLKRKDGKHLTTLLTANVVRDKSGRIQAYRGIIRDITDRKQLEQQLLHSQKMESIGTLAGGVAHDFNNLLSGILGYASLMKTKIPNTEQLYNYANTIERSATRAAELTAQLLAFARGGKYEVAPVNLNFIIEENLELINRTFNKSIEIRKVLLDDLPTIDADSTQIAQVVMNLCLNANDAMPNGGLLTIETAIETLTDEYVRTHVGAKVGTYVALSITDDGVGMDKETLQRIFEPFFTTKEKGTGLGLSMIYGVVKNHGGYVQVYSEQGCGTTFKVYLPMNGQQEPKTFLKPEQSQRGSELVLVVDDEESIRYLAKDILGTYGYGVLLAENGEEALQIYRERQEEIDLVILDMVMPKLGGRETFLELKKLNPGIRALLSSGYSKSGRAKEILDNGVMGFVQKPFLVDALLSKVREALDESVPA